MDCISLADLSTEILLQICRHFCLHCQDEYSEAWDTRPLCYQRRREEQKRDAKSWYALNRHALFSLSLASKRLRNIAQPILYHEFVLGYDDSWRTDFYSWNGRLGSFMRSITRNPDLASLVKVVHIHTLLLKSQTSEENRAVIQETASSLGIDLPSAWRQRVEKAPGVMKWGWPSAYQLFMLSKPDGKGDLDDKEQWGLAIEFHHGRQLGPSWMNGEMVAMLVAQLPNLDRLSLPGSFDCWPFQGFPDTALSALNISTLGLKTLDLGVRADALIQVATGLETLNLHQYEFWPDFPQMPNLKTIRITEGRFSVDHMKHILSACTGGLRCFEYEAAVDRPSLPAPHNHPFHLSDAILHLQMHKNTLQTVHLDVRRQKAPIRRIDRDIDFKSFTALEHLFLGARIICSRKFSPEPGDLPESHGLIRLIPSSIVSLSVTQTRNRNRLKSGLEGLANWVNLHPGAFPRLKWVRCGGEATSVGSMFSVAGVDFGHKICSLSSVKPYLNGEDRAPGYMQITGLDPYEDEDEY
ncbi:hypothetical protein FALBO_6076 [Fusarium albosuccineum]|uniref:Uncharacterized protein n=1 Tax=Fusarium albosuccineum TaxID=1237068 RepID=A0A8H4LCU4_9HYPO|nr:hypothetical protein FALBO_6076 [Fusarium albosuccineum]